MQIEKWGIQTGEGLGYVCVYPQWNSACFFFQIGIHLKKVHDSMRQQAHVDELRPEVQKKVTYFHESLVSSSQAAQILFQFTPAKAFSKFMKGVEPAIHTG